MCFTWLQNKFPIDDNKLKVEWIGHQDIKSYLSLWVNIIL